MLVLCKELKLIGMNSYVKSDFIQKSKQNILN